MEEITVRIPSDRFADFFTLYAQWLAAPNASTWTHTAPSAPVARPWDPTRVGEAEKASELWQALDDSQQAVIDAVAASGKVEVAQLAIALALKGSVAVVQQIAAVNAAARKIERTDVFELTFQTNEVVVELDNDARKALIRQPTGAG